jgi:AbrB family looped-hinge helix DNA binding protein
MACADPPGCMAAIDCRPVRQYLTQMKTAISTKGQIVLPAEFRQLDGIEPGQEFEVERIDRGEYRLKLCTPRRNEGLVKLLLACPVKDWFKPMDRTQTTDDINLPGLG